MNDSSTSSFRLLRSPVVICLLLALAAFAVYSPVRNYGFVDYDDSGYFFENPHVLGGLTMPNIKWAFTSGEDANWHPLTWLSLMLDSTLFGSGAAAPHLTNFLLHAANSILLFLLLLRLTATVWRSAAVAMLFAIHPLHVESVAWVAERKDVLSGFFSLLTLLCYARYAADISLKKEAVSPPAAHRFPSSYWLALFFFVCGLMSKPMVVTLPFVLLLLDYWPLGRFNLGGTGTQSVPAGNLSASSTLPPAIASATAGLPCRSLWAKAGQRLLVEKIPFFLLSAAACVVTFIVQKKGGAVTALTRIPMTVRVENTFVSYARYLAKIFLPVNLATPYPAPGYWPALLVLLCIALFVALGLFAVAWRKRFPFFLTGWFWFAGMLVPVIGLVQVGGAAMADRYMYLPIIGILIIVSWGVGEVCLKWMPPQRVLVGFATFLFLVCALRARNQVTNWESDLSLFGHAFSVTKGNYIAALNIGYWYSKNGEPGPALDYYQKAMQVNPDDPNVLYNIGTVMAKLGRWNDAIPYFQRALQLTPDDADILDNLGFALAQNRQLPDAITCFQAALKLKPDSADAHNNLATMLFAQGNYAEAAEQYTAAVKLSPDNPHMIVNLADTLVRLGRKTEAAQYYRRALEIQPDNETVRNKLESLRLQ